MYKVSETFKVMKARVIITAVAALMSMCSCKPEAYTGDLDSVIGNWEGIGAEYYFNGESVATADSCIYPAISFYRQGLCCIEGMKGAFEYVYDHSSGNLQIDSTLWNVTTLNGTSLVMTFTGWIFPDIAGQGMSADDTAQSDEMTGQEEDAVRPDKNGVILPAEFKGITIEADGNGYYYMDAADSSLVYCGFIGHKNAADSLIIDYWYDSHTDRFIPLIVESKK